MNKMKFSPIGKLLFACAMVVFLGGCTDKVTETVYVDFSLSRYSVAFPVEGGTTSLSVGTTDNWTAAADVSWLALSVEGSTLFITAEANEEAVSVREGVITVTTTSYGSADVQVRQEPAAAPTISLSYSNDSHTIDSEGGHFTVNVSSNYDWAASFANEVSGWTLYEDHSLDLLTVVAEANSGDPLSGTVVVTAHSGSLSASESFELTQSSRADNTFFRFMGDWDIYSDDCDFMGERLGPGVYTSCTFAEYNYSDGLMSFLNFQDLEGIQCDTFEYNAEEGTLSVLVGALCGSMVYNGTTYSVYLMCSSQYLSTVLISPQPVIVFKLSEDGNSISVSGFNENYPVLGYVAYKSGDGYGVLNDIMHYIYAPWSLTRKTSPSSISPLSLPSNITFTPASELPDDVPTRISEDVAEAEISYVLTL